MSGSGEFTGAIDGLRGVEEVRPQYRHDALEVYAGIFEGGGAARAVELRAVPAGADSTTREAFTGIAQSWWSVSDLEGVVDLLRWGVEPRPWALVADDGGETLATAWETVDDETVTDIVTAVGETLAAASAEGVMHGNLRPAHVRLPEGESPVLVDDWGLGRAVGKASDGDFVTGFTAPEQLEGSATDGAAVDTYGLAALAYFALTERPPFPEERAAILGERPQPVSAFRPDLPGAVDDLVMRGLRRDPDERPGGPGAFAAEFREAMAGGGAGTAAGGAAAGGVAGGAAAGSEGTAAGSADAEPGDEPTAGEGSAAGEGSEDGDGVGGAAGGAAAGGVTAGGTAEAGGPGSEDQGGDPSGAAGAAGGAGPDDTGPESSPDSRSPEEPTAESDSPGGEDAGPLPDEESGPLAGDDSGPLADETPGPLGEGDSEPLVGDDTGPLADEDSGPLGDEGSDGVAEPGTDTVGEAGAGALSGESGPPATGADETGGTDAPAEDDSRVNRRTVLAGGGLLAALAAVGAGAWAFLGGSGSGGADLSVVPDRAETIAAVDVAGLRESEAFAGALNARLPLSLPLLDADTLAGVLDGVASRTGMDPGGVQEAVFFAARSAGPETYAAAVLETEWDAGALPANLEEAAEAVSEETYADSRLLVAEYADLPFPVAVGEVSEGRYAVGTRVEVEDVLETASGSTPPVEGREVEAFRAAADGQLRLGSLFPANVVSAALPGSVPEQVAAALTETARNVEYVSGSVGADGSARLEAETGSTEAAETAAAQLRAASTLAADELGGTDAAGPLATLARLLDEATVSREETTVTVTLEGAYELFAAGLAAAE